MELEKEIFQKEFRNIYHKAAVNIFFTYNWLIEKQIKVFKPYGITIQQFNILRILRGQYPDTANLKLIKKRMLDKMSDVSRLVEKLRTKNLVERTICPSDRRNVDVIITSKGLALLSEIDNLNEEMDNFLLGLTEKEITALNNYLDKLRG